MSDISLDKLISFGQQLEDDFVNMQIGNPPYSEDWRLPIYAAYTEWKNICLRFLHENYRNDISVEDFKCAVKKFDEKKDLESFSEIIGVLKSYKAYPKILKDNTNSSNKSSHNGIVNVSVNNHNSNSQQQSQEQQLTLDLFISAIDNELTGKQRKELKAYLEETKDQPEEERKKGIVEKLKSFGTDLALNILTNIITNPAIWGAL